MMYLIPLIAVGASRAIMTLPLPDVKPFSCMSCLSFWICALICLCIDWQLIPLGFLAYLLSDIILIYEYKR